MYYSVLLGTQVLKYKIVKHKKPNHEEIYFVRLVTYTSKQACKDFIKELPKYDDKDGDKYGKKV